MASPFRRSYPPYQPLRSDESVYGRIGNAYNIVLDTSATCVPDFWNWVCALAEAHDTRPEYFFFMLMPTVAALVGPETQVQVSERYKEKMNMFICILGESGSGKSSAFQLVTRPLYQEKLEDLLLKSTWTRNGLIAHLEANKGRCLIAYEEMDSFFAGIVKGQKEGNADRSFFCELYDGSPVQSVRSSNDGKRLKRSLEAVSLSIGGFHQPQPFLREHFDLHERRDGFLERFVLACPCPKRLLPEELVRANEKLDQYPPELQSTRRLYSLVSEFHQVPRSYRLSDPAKELYISEMAEQAEQFNAVIEQRRQGGHSYHYEELSSKKMRLFLKFAGILHVVEETFNAITIGGAHGIVEIPETISAETSRRAMALVDYFNSQKEVLLQSQTTTEETAAVTVGHDTGLKIKDRVMCHPGLFVTPRNCVKAISTTRRPKTDEVIGEMKYLAEKGFGQMISVGRCSCFGKTFPIQEDKLTKENISPFLYRESLTKTDKHLSGHQLDVFRRAHSEYERIASELGLNVESPPST